VSDAAEGGKNVGLIGGTHHFGSFAYKRHIYTIVNAARSFLRNLGWRPAFRTNNPAKRHHPSHRVAERLILAAADS